MDIYGSVTLDFNIRASPFMKLMLYSQIQGCKRRTAMVGKIVKLFKKDNVSRRHSGIDKDQETYYYYYHYCCYYYYYYN